MRARNVKPDLWKDVALAELPIEARYLFPALWCMADCEGRLEDIPKRIKVEVYPYDDSISAARVNELLQLLAESGFICRYEVDRRGYIQIRNFVKHQNPHKNEREKGSQIPALPAARAVPINSVPVPINSEQVPFEDGTARADSLLLIPDSRFPIPSTSATAPVVRMTPRPPSVPMSERFEEFWSRHPGKKLRKDLAAGVWAHMVTVENDGDLFACLERYLDSQEVANRAFMNPENWLSECAAGGFTASWPARASPGGAAIVKTKQQQQADEWRNA